MSDSFEIPDVHYEKSAVYIRSAVLVVFIKQLISLLKAGISLYPAITIISSETGATPLKALLKTLRHFLQEGMAFSEAISYFPRTFSLFFINMVKVGENKGSLLSSLERLLVITEKKLRWQQKLISALIYPAILVFFGFIILIAMWLFILPRFVEVFTQNEVPLPLPTKIFIVTSTILNQFWWLIAIVIVIVIVMGSWMLKKPKFRREYDRIKLSFPVFGSVLYYNHLMDFASNLGTLYGRGVPLLRALRLSAETLNNHYILYKMEFVISNIKDGDALWLALKKIDFFPLMMIQMIQIGEESAELSDLLINTAAYLEEELDVKIDQQLALIEPISLAIIGGFIAFVSASFLLPLFRMSGMLRH